MDKIFKKVVKTLCLFFIGFFLYMGIEIAFRGFTHWTMGIVGGLCFIIIGGLNEFYHWDLPFWKQCLIGAVVITIIEFFAGIFLNKILQLNIWDYSTVPFNIMGQVCLPFSIAWFFLSGIAIVLDDWIRYLFFAEEKPRYIFFKRKI